MKQKQDGDPSLQRVRIVLVTSALMFVSVYETPCQYQLHQWTSFEDRKLPDNAITIGSSADKTVGVVDLSTVTGMPDNFYDGVAKEELGSHALRLRANPPEAGKTSVMNGIVINVAFDRDELGPKGTALFQADFYIPATQEWPNLAVLAMTPSTDVNTTSSVKNVPSLQSSYYRWGITVNSVPYFSFTEPGKPKPTQFLQDRDLIPLLPKPGWHRFNMLISAERVECFVDGRGTVFSPAAQIELRKLMVGVILAESKLSYDAYVDNISIQVSRESLRLPDSPYDKDWTVPAGMAARKGAVAPGAFAVRDQRWLNATQAWQKAQQDRKPLLLMFCSPGLPKSDNVEKMFSAGGSERILSEHVAARIDVNQLKGSEIAREYRVFKVPTFIVISPDAKSYKRYVPAPADTIQKIARELEL